MYFGVIMCDAINIIREIINMLDYIIKHNGETPICTFDQIERRLQDLAIEIGKLEPNASILDNSALEIRYLKDTLENLTSLKNTIKDSLITILPKI